MQRSILSASALVLTLSMAPSAAAAAPGKVDVLMQKALADVPGREALVLTVAYAPGGSDGLHRHDAHVFVYVLEGAIEMQTQGGRLVALKKGQTFYESPDDIHVVGRNASKTKAAKFLVFFVKKTDTPPVIPVKP